MEIVPILQYQIRIHTMSVPKAAMVNHHVEASGSMDHTDPVSDIIKERRPDQIAAILAAEDQSPFPPF